ncbi:hypothetical protein [Caballeronia sp. GAWG1-5s-s]|uniref:hypothetical protein n=1 Tax=Caballeronia sp. GAWG1-5s-s TaxID=2921743 RepID=UPI00202976B9|nr:hypothetical protein [Caballeronia sp. GAWG1-5s-s]
MLDKNGAMILENAEWKRTWAGNAVLDSVVDYESYRGFRPETGERLSADEWPCAMSLKEGVRTRDVILDIERFNGARGTGVVSSAPIRDDTGHVVGVRSLPTWTSPSFARPKRVCWKPTGARTNFWPCFPTSCETRLL